MMKEFVLSPNNLVFSLKVREMCKSCKRYGKKANCPPYIEPVEYFSNLLPRYSYGTLFVEEFPVLGQDFDELSISSTMCMYEKISNEKEKLFVSGHYLFVGFSGGSCKLCDTCTFPCHLPHKALTPLEGTGLDVVKLLKNFNIEISFPVKEIFYRVGALFYD